MNRLMKMMLVFMALAILLAGCDSIALWKQTNKEYDKDNTKIQSENANVKKPPAPVADKNEAYVDTKPISLNREPSWYSAPVTINASGLPFSFYVTQLLGTTSVQVHMDPGVNPARPVNMRYTGTVKGALEELAAKSGYYYDYDLDKNAITWSALETKTFDISFIPGVSKYSVGVMGGSNTIAGGSSSSSSSSSGGTTATTSGIDVTATGEYSNLGNDNLSVWDDIKNTITTLLSPKGKMSVSQATTTVTVRDRPANVSDITRYLDQMNKILSKQVHFEVQILDVTLNKQFQYGINWQQVAYNIGSGGGDVSFSANLSGAAGGILTVPNSAVGAATYNGGAKSKWAGTTVILNALEQQGKVSIINQPSLTTLNDQVAQLAILNQQSYLASQTNTITSGANSTASGFSQQSLTPGIVNSGLQLYLLPKIQDDKIYLQISSTLSTLTAINIVSQTGQTTAQGGTPPENTTSAIQVPVLSQKNFNQRNVLRNGQTLVLAGYKGLTDANQKDSVAGLTALGGMAAASNNEELVVLITPIIVDGDNF